MIQGGSEVNAADKIKKVDPDLEIVWMLVEYRKPCHHRGKPHVEIDGIKINKHSGAYKGFLRRMNEVELKDNEKVEILITAFDEENFPTTFENPNLISSEPNAITIETDQDGKIWAVGGTPGLNSRVTGNIDAKIGEGTMLIDIEPIDFTIIPGEAVRATTSLGTPIHK
jgi:hypothetical protein